MPTTSAHNATHITRHDHGTQRTLLPLRLISSHTSKSRNAHVSLIAMPLSSPWRSWRPCVISRFKASLMSLLPCSSPVRPTITTTTFLNSPEKPPSRCCCFSGPQQSNNRPYQSNGCTPASHAVTCAASPSIKSHSHPHFKHARSICAPPSLTCPCLPS